MISSNQILVVLLVIVTGNYVINFIVKVINIMSMSKQIPPDLEDYYDASSYSRAIHYHHSLNNISLLSDFVSQGIVVALLLVNGFAWLSQEISNEIQNEILQGVIFFVVLVLGRFILQLPFKRYLYFVVEKKYDFSSGSVRTFLQKVIVELILTVTITGIAAGLFISYCIEYNVHSIFPWFITCGGLILLFFVINYFYSSVINFLFYRIEPVGSVLKKSIASLADYANFPINRIFILKNSPRAGAFFSGFGGRKRILLSEALVSNFTEKDILGILSHELGHYCKNHLLWGYSFSVLKVILFVLGFYMVMNEVQFSLVLGSLENRIHLTLLSFLILIAPLFKVINLLEKFYYRRCEFEADHYSKKICGRNYLSEPLKKISVSFMDNLSPHPLYVFCFNAHPPLVKRLRALDAEDIRK